MAHKARLKLSEVRQVFRIVQDAIDHGEDPVAWRLQMLERMNELIGSAWGVSFLTPIEVDPDRLGPPVYVYTKPPNDSPVWGRFLKGFDVSKDPITPPIIALAHRPVTRLRRDLVDDQTWYGSEHYKTVREPLRIDDMIHAHDPLPRTKVTAVLGFTRLTGAESFGPREKKLVDLLRRELRHRWVSIRPIDEPRLTPRQRQLVAHLQGPMSEKQIAAYMNLRYPTVHNYVKGLYRKLDVTSRAELTRKVRATDRSRMPRLGYGDS